MDWNEFAQRLTRELMHLPIDAYVVVQGFGGMPYVQAMRYRSGLHAEAVSSDYLPEPLSPQQERTLAELGWQPPDGDKRRNWWCRVKLPAEPAEITREQAAQCRALAERMAAAFCDVYGVPSAADLCYEAAHNGEGPEPLSLPGLGVDRADQEPAAPAGPPPPPQWAVFAEQLACELASMQPQMGLVISQRHQESYYVQAFCDARRVHAEAVSGQALPPGVPVFDAALEEQLAAVGWRWPGDHPNWTFELPTGAEPEEFRRLAEMMVVALREVHLTRDPGDLVYEAFIGSSQVELTELGIPPVDPARVEIRKTSPPLPSVRSDTPSRSARHADPEIEAALAAAKNRGDRSGYLNIVLRARLYVPVASDGRPLTTDYHDGTYLLAFTSPDAMDCALEGPLRDYRRTTFAELACQWPDPAWRLAINTRLPSAAYIDTDTIRQVAEHARSGRPLSFAPPATASAAPTSPDPDAASRPGDLAGPQRTDHGDPGSGAAAPGVPPPSASAPVPDPRPGDAESPARPGRPPATAPTDLPVAGKAARAATASAGAAAPTGVAASGPRTPRGGGEPLMVPVAGKAARATAGPHTRPAGPAADPPAAGETARRGAVRIAETTAGAAHAPDEKHGEASRAPVEPARASQAEEQIAEPLRDGEVMQKVVRPDHVAHYLDGGYDWVAGPINRLRDVSGLRTPEQLVRALGLERPGSPFSTRDEAVHVIRWPLIRPALVRPVPGAAVPTFRIGSRRLPHGAEMFRLDRAGTETFLAVYDADRRAWLRTAEVDG